MVKGLAILALPILLTLPLVLSHQTVGGMSVLGPVSVMYPTLFDTRGQEITYLEIGRQVVVRLVLQSNLISDQHFVVLTEIRDEAGISQYLAWQSGKLSATGNYTTETSWVPDSGCYENSSECNDGYQIRVFVLSGLENPQVLSEVVVRDIAVIQAGSKADKIYALELDSELHSIRYSLGSGGIQEIIADPSLATIRIQLHNVAADASLELTFPKELNRLLFPDASPESISDDMVEPIIFIDSIPENLKDFQVVNDEISFSVDIPRGAKEVEIIGAWLP